MKIVGIEIMERVNLIKPGVFSIKVAADDRRGEFDCKNEVIVTNKELVDFIFIGDSVIQMWELNAYFGRNNKLILNRGIGGDTTEYVLKRFEADVLQLKPRYCIMGIGVNDAWTLEPDPWAAKSGEQIEVVQEKAVRNLVSIIDLAIKNHQKLALCSILPTNITFTQKNEERNKYILRTNEQMRQICKEKGIIYVDYYSYFVDSDGITLKDGLTIEGLHPHVFGYNIMVDVLRETLRNNGIEI